MNVENVLTSLVFAIEYFFSVDSFVVKLDVMCTHFSLLSFSLTLHLDVALSYSECLVLM